MSSLLKGLFFAEPGEEGSEFVDQTINKIIAGQDTNNSITELKQYANEYSQHILEK